MNNKNCNRYKSKYKILKNYLLSDFIIVIPWILLYHNKKYTIKNILTNLIGITISDKDSAIKIYHKNGLFILLM